MDVRFLSETAAIDQSTILVQPARALVWGMKIGPAYPHGAQLYATILLLIALPMLALALLGIWFSDAQRVIATEAGRQQQQDAARRLAGDVIRGVQAQTRQRMDGATTAWTEGGAQRLRAHYMGDPAITMVALFGPDGERLFPGPEEASLFAENRQLRQSERRLDDLQAVTGNKILWAGSLSEPTSPAIACRNNPGGRICLMLRVDNLRQWAEGLADGAILVDLNALPPAPSGMVQAVSPLPAPFAGFAVLMNYRPGPRRNISMLALLLAPTLLGSVIAASFAMRAHRAQIGAAQQRIDMLSGLSHDLRTPLANLRLYASLLRKPDLPLDRLARYADVIGREAAQLSASVDHVLSAATRDTAPVLRRVSPDQLIADLLDRYRPAFANALPPLLDLKTPGPALFDTAAFESILLNLLENARKHAPMSRPVIATRLRDGRLLLSVSDRGQPAVQPDRSGYGLGLKTCRAMAKRAGGRFDATISPDGSRFRLELPDHSVPATTKGGEHAPAHRRG